MKKLIFILFLLTSPILSYGQVSFDTYFSNYSLRIDFELAGNATNEFAILQEMRKEPFWGGNPNYLIDKKELGDFRVCIKTPQNELLYSRGFNSLFREWQTIPEAKQINRSFHHAIQLPFPKDSVKVCIESRQKNGVFQTLLTWLVNPQDYLITKEKVPTYKIDTLTYAGKSSDYLDLVFIAEGYTKKQIEKFRKDALRFQKWIFDVSPFSSYRGKVNIYALATPSEESTPDMPSKGIYNNTVLNASFYTFRSPRYLTVRDTKKMYDIAASVPYDHIYVLVNTDTYGGAGFYNTYTSCAVDCKFAEEIASHELGHGLAGLADEYYNNGDEVNYYYNLDKEPWEPNISTLANFRCKWQHLVDKSTPIPTMRKPQYKNSLGAFEGGAYQSKGIYSPMQDCKMKSNNTKEFCPACQEAIKAVIDTYLK